MSAIVRSFEHSLPLPFFGIGMKTDLSQSCGHCQVFQICWQIERSTFTELSFRILTDGQEQEIVEILSKQKSRGREGDGVAEA